MALVDFMIEHRQRIMQETDGNPDSEWWEGLEESWPELHGAAKWRTFDQTFKRILPALLALIESDREKVRLEKLLKARTERLHRVEAGLPPEPTAQAHLPKINGWKVQLSPDGYFRAHKRFGKRLYSCYVGKKFDVDKFREKVMAREQAIMDKKRNR